MVMEAAADALAAGQSCSLGGFIRHPQLGQLWFSEAFSRVWGDAKRHLML